MKYELQYLENEKWITVDSENDTEKAKELLSALRAMNNKYTWRIKKIKQ